MMVAAAWADWFDRSYICQLDDNLTQCSAAGVSSHAVERQLLGDEIARPLTEQRAHRLRRGFQGCAATLLTTTRPEELEPRVRHKLERWAVDQYPRIRVSHGMRFLRILGKTAPPRIWAAPWRAMWNGWPTSRRTQGRSGLPGCMFGCAESSQDSIEHYANCTTGHSVMARDLGMSRAATPRGRGQFPGP
ncbi:unnamed protein product [Prorocentrum cordatum]|uniref:Uncharacterized protein n=1 Tax=Prorocentrum cordatum TaxID=2364126 RepID=A0ABN9WI09_9DINO|nr:unnamed protein product [Polarella glacialis]